MAESTAIQVATLASGSSGNSVFIRCGDTQLLLDAGISRKRLQASLSEFGTELGDLSAILLTHEHRDHINGMERIRKREPHVPVYCSAGTIAGCQSDYGLALSATTVRPGTPFSIGSAQISPFRVPHDARECLAYRIDFPGLSLALATDLGEAQHDVRAMLTGCDVLLLECNYDVELLRWGNYPGWLKNRVASARGHLSNWQAQQTLRLIASSTLRHVFLLHMSEENNLADRAVEAAKKGLRAYPGVRITLAPRHEPCDLQTFEPRDEYVRKVRPLSAPRQGVLSF